MNEAGGLVHAQLGVHVERLRERSLGELGAALALAQHGGVHVTLVWDFAANPKRPSEVHMIAGHASVQLLCPPRTLGDTGGLIGAA